MSITISLAEAAEFEKAVCQNMRILFPTITKLSALFLPSHHVYEDMTGTRPLSDVRFGQLYAHQARPTCAGEMRECSIRLIWKPQFWLKWQWSRWNRAKRNRCYTANMSRGIYCRYGLQNWLSDVYTCWKGTTMLMFTASSLIYYTRAARYLHFSRCLLYVQWNNFNFLIILQIF